jgi:hypothetical protein
MSILQPDSIIITCTLSEVTESTPIDSSMLLHQTSYSKQPLSRTLSEGELSAYSTASSVRDAIASCRQTRENIRKSRASMRVLLQESRQTIDDARDLRNALQLLLLTRGQSRFLLEESDLDSEAGSQPSFSEVSDMTPVDGT